MSTRPKGKRQLLSPQELKEQETESQIYECDALAPPAKRLKAKHDDEEPPPSPPPRPKRDFDHAFASTTTTTTTATAMTPPPARRARMVSSNSSSSDCQSAGQVTTESPQRNKMPGMNGLLGQLHAERKQRQQNPCPLTQGMSAMSIQTPQRARHCIQLHTDSKLAW